jgi:hypothetical protein
MTITKFVWIKYGDTFITPGFQIFCELYCIPVRNFFSQQRTFRGSAYTATGIDETQHSATNNSLPNNSYVVNTDNINSNHNNHNNNNNNNNNINSNHNNHNNNKLMNYNDYKNDVFNSILNANTCDDDENKDCVGDTNFNVLENNVKRNKIVKNEETTGIELNNV